MKLLLRAGASPDSKNVIGNTAVHLGAGFKGTQLSMELADMCIRAAKTSFLYGKDVVLEGLKSADMNGKKGVVGGYDPDTDRRSVYVPEDRTDVSLVDLSRHQAAFGLLPVVRMVAALARAQAKKNHDSSKEKAGNVCASCHKPLGERGNEVLKVLRDLLLQPRVPSRPLEERRP
ncbi:unnamed protein product [Cylindrotheca closterium]|uniref:Uncharacterized protein n=1 Tax=Cylindrotheca closterium TaxID=2856 RepID=A0AAD2CZJ4_9STRA|nr:unnamed protein product [Cylindrotheca closterium]